MTIAPTPTPVPWASIASTGLSVLGSVFGGKKKRGPSPHDLRVEENRNRDWHMQTTMDLAKKYGVSPLTIMGMPSTGGGYSTASTSYEEPSLGQRLAEGGADIARSVAAGSSNLEKLQERLLTAQIEGQEIDNVARASATARTFQAGNPPASSSLAEKLGNVKLNKMGYADGLSGIHKVGLDENGNPIRVYNTDELGDNELAQAFHTLRYTVPDYIHGNLAKPFARGLRKFFGGDKSAYRTYRK